MLRTPSAIEGEGGAIREDVARAKGRMLQVRDQMAQLAQENGLKVSASIEMMPTPTVFHVSMHDEPIETFLAREEKSSTGQIGKSLGVAIRMEQALMPTPNTMDHLPARTPEQKAANKGKGGYANVRETVVNDLMPTPKALDGIKGNLKTSQERIDAGHFVDLTNIAVDLALIGTPRATASESSSSQVADGASKGRIEDQVLLTNWGKFEPAIRRWEETLGRPAPAPTQPDGKDGAHRLSPWFTEWMMGLPEGWICDPEIGLTRNEQLKACGNGVVPQQAELALRILLDGMGFDSPKDDESLLPTVMANSPMRNSRRSMVTHPTKRSGVALNQALELIAGLLPSEFESWDEVPDNYRDLEPGGRMVNLPTPTVSDTFTDSLASTQQKDGSMHSVTLPQAVRGLTFK
jgi:hypothetical protein